jgi:hypothetical protein
MEKKKEWNGRTRYEQRIGKKFNDQKCAGNQEQQQDDMSLFVHNPIFLFSILVILSPHCTSLFTFFLYLIVSNDQCLDVLTSFYFLILLSSFINFSFFHHFNIFPSNAHSFLHLLPFSRFCQGLWRVASAFHVYRTQATPVFTVYSASVHHWHIACPLHPQYHHRR